MRKILILLLLLLLLVACGSATETEDAANTDSDIAAVPTETPGTVTQEESTEDSPDQSDLEAENTGSTAEDATVVREQDHVKGAADPTVTIIEYGDYQ